MGERPSGAAGARVVNPVRGVSGGTARVALSWRFTSARTGEASRIRPRWSASGRGAAVCAGPDGTGRARVGRGSTARPTPGVRIRLSRRDRVVRRVVRTGSSDRFPDRTARSALLQRSRLSGLAPVILPQRPRTGGSTGRTGPTGRSARHSPAHTARGRSGHPAARTPPLLRGVVARDRATPPRATSPASRAVASHVVLRRSLRHPDAALPPWPPDRGPRREPPARRLVSERRRAGGVTARSASAWRSPRPRPPPAPTRRPRTRRR